MESRHVRGVNDTHTPEAYSETRDAWHETPEA